MTLTEIIAQAFGIAGLIITVLSFREKIIFGKYGFEK